MSTYVLMPVAKEDLVCIRTYYLEEAGYRVARQMVVEFVEAFRFGTHSGRGPQARGPCRGPAHLVLGNAGLPDSATKPLQILSVIRGSQDVPRMIGRRGF